MYPSCEICESRPGLPLTWTRLGVAHSTLLVVAGAVAPAVLRLGVAAGARARLYPSPTGLAALGVV